MNRIREILAVLGVLVLALILFHDGVVWGALVLSGGDIVNNDLPMRLYWLRSGFTTAWYAPSFSGYPLFANIQHGALYPFNWLYWIGLPPERTVSWLAMLHFLIGGAGFYQLARLRLSRMPALVSAVLWMCGGYVILRLTNGVIIFIYGTTWIPWLWKEAEQCGPGRINATARLALFGALQFFAGAPQLVQITWGGLALWMLGRLIASGDWKTRIGIFCHFIAAGLLVAVIAFPQLIATAQFSSLAANRGQNSDWQYLTADSLSPHLILTNIAPEFFDVGIEEATYWGGRIGYHEHNAYIGVAALLLALFANVTLLMRVRKKSLQQLERAEARWLFSLLALMLVGIAIALGRYTIIYRILYELVPGFDLFRVPARWVIWWYAPACLFAGWGLSLLKQSADETTSEDQRHNAIKPWLIASAILLLPLVLLLAFHSSAMNLFGFGKYGFSQIPELEQELIAKTRGSIAWALSLAGLAALLGIAAIVRRLSIKAATGILCAILLIDLLRFWQPYRNTYPSDIETFQVATETPFHRIRASEFRERFYPESPLANRLHQQNPGRIFYTDDVMHPNFDQFTREFFAERSVVLGFDSMRGYQPLQLASYVDEFNEIAFPETEEVSGGSFLFAPFIESRWPLDAYNATHYFTFASTMGSASDRQAILDLGLDSQGTVPAGPVALELWRNPHAAGWAWFSTDGQWPGLDNRIENARISVNRAADQQAVEATAPQPGLILHFAETDYPGWTIDATNQTTGNHFTADGRSILLPEAGEYQITRQYKLPTATRAGIPISILATIMLLVVAFWRRPKSEIPHTH